MKTPELDAPLLLGRYRPLTLLARGGMSVVFQGRDEVLGRDVAIKVFSAGGESDVERYREELRMLASLSHHGVVSIIDAGIDESSPDDPRPFLVMELVRGRTLSSTIAKKQLSARAIGELGFEIAETLEYVHARGVVHRDVTPANIMLVDYGTTTSRPRARLTDFGIATDIGSQPAANGETTGTAAYFSPEQALNYPVGPASDIYSLGLVLLESFTRELAFPGEPIPSAVKRITDDPPIPGTVPEEWAGLIRSMTARDPLSRPTAAAVADAARRALRRARTPDPKAG